MMLFGKWMRDCKDWSLSLWLTQRRLERQEITELDQILSEIDPPETPLTMSMNIAQGMIMEKLKMSTPLFKPTLPNPTQTERLALLAEEAAEVIHVVGKILRHGFTSYNPDIPDSNTNRDDLEKEVGDLLAAVKLCYDELILNKIRVKEAKKRKLEKVLQWLHCKPTEWDPK